MHGEIGDAEVRVLSASHGEPGRELVGGGEGLGVRDEGADGVVVGRQVLLLARLIAGSWR